MQALRDQTSGPAKGNVAAEVRVDLLNGFDLSYGGNRVCLPIAEQRLVAFLALQERPVRRLFVAGKLWIDASEERASASLRTTLWRLTRAARGVVSANGSSIGLSPRVGVDVRDATTRARRIINRPRDYSESDWELLSGAGDLLPDWYDDWLLIERERFRQLRVHALEELCNAFAAEGRYAEAADTGLAAVAMEPLRESSHRALIAAYLAEGNPSEALRQYRMFRRLLAEQLGLEPSSAMRSLIADAQIGHALGI